MIRVARGILAAASLLACFSLSAGAQNWQQQQLQQQQIQRQMDMQRQQQQQMQMQRQMEMQRQQQQMMRQQKAMQQQRLQQQQMQRQQAVQQQRQLDIQRQGQLRQGSAANQNNARAAQRRAEFNAARGVTPATGSRAASGPNAPRITRPLTANEIRQGFKGQVSGNRALVNLNGRTYTVPRSRVSGLIRTSSSGGSQNSTAKLRSDRARHLRLVASGGGGSRPGGDREHATSMARRAQLEADRKVKNKVGPGVQLPPVSRNDPMVVAARARRGEMERSNRGFNVSSREDDQYAEIGRERTYLTDKAAIDHIIQKYTRIQGGKRVASVMDSANIERELGLDSGSLSKGIKIRQVTGIDGHKPALPQPYEGGRFYRGIDRHLPGGHPEVVIDRVARNAPNVELLYDIEVR